AIPALLRVVKGALKDVLEEVLPDPQAAEQEHRKQQVEDCDLDLNPHGVAGQQGQAAERDRYATRDDGKNRKPPENKPHGDNRKTSGDEQSPGTGFDPIHRVDDEHGDQRPEFAGNIDSLLGVERVDTPQPAHRLAHYTSSAAEGRLSYSKAIARSNSPASNE